MASIRTELADLRSALSDKQTPQHQHQHPTPADPPDLRTAVLPPPAQHQQQRQSQKRWAHHSAPTATLAAATILALEGIYNRQRGKWRTCTDRLARGLNSRNRQSRRASPFVVRPGRRPICDARLEALDPAPF